MNRKVLIVWYDVEDLTEAQIGRLQMEAVVQAEASDDGEDGHPDVRVLYTEVLRCPSNILARVAAPDMRRLPAEESPECGA